MKEELFYDEQKRLVLERFKTLNMDSKLMLGGEGEVTVKELIRHIENGDDFGRRAVRVQIKMLKILANA
ncbi:hypothetical protein JXB27_00075 [Candidatus Woesearchaeota archaeon]|nr:hypothetical protein [Candidatus Woesearchaeota archaeon]